MSIPGFMDNIPESFSQSNWQRVLVGFASGSLPCSVTFGTQHSLEPNERGNAKNTGDVPRRSHQSGSMKQGSSLSKTDKRELDFRSGQEVIAEIERLRASGYVRSKKWNLTQICEHLTATMVGEMDGLGFRLPWPIRATFGKLFTHWILWARKMPSVPTLPSLQPKSSSDTEEDSIIQDCLHAIARSEAFTGSLEDYPFVDNLQHDQWRQFMWIHASHHLGFLIPKTQRD